VAVVDTPSVLPGTKTPSVIINDTVNGLPVVIGAAPGQVTLTSTPNGPLTMNPDGTISVTANTPAGTYPISYTICEVNNPSNCSTVTATVTVTEKPSITIVMTAHFNDDHKDGFAVIGETITYSFTVTNSGNVPLTNVIITDPLTGIVLSGGPISLGIGQINSIAFTGIYSLTKEDLLLGMVTNQATAFGTSPLNNIVKDLSDSSSSLNNNPTVIPIDGCKIEVFNAVSPNGDGDNDVFYIRGLECYTDNTVEIYNRWGVLVFERSGYNNSDRAFKGFSEGRVTVNKSEELPVGTYFYILKYKDNASNAFEKAGYLYLNR
jgi:gliding motility-associated-like protein